jgi:hypothetical protein
MDRNTYHLYEGGLYLAKPEHEWKKAKLQRQKTWQNQLEQCQTETCIGNHYLNRLCSWHTDRSLNYPPLKARDLDKKFKTVHQSVIAESGVFIQRYRYICDQSNPNWSAYLKLIGPYQSINNFIKDIQFETAFVLNGPDEMEEDPVCQAFNTLLNGHKNKQELLCNLPDLSLAPDFAKPPMRPLSKKEKMKYKKFLSWSQFNYSFDEGPAIGKWQAFKMEHEKAPEEVHILRQPLFSLCLAKEQINSESSFFASPITPNPRHYIEELLRTKIPVGNYRYSAIYPERNFSGHSDLGQLFIYKGITYSYYPMHSIIRFHPMARSNTCKINKTVIFEPSN